MKKSTILMLVMIGAAVFSCSTVEKEAVTSEEVSTAFVDLQADLQKLNQVSFGEMPTTRAPWWRWALTFGADLGVGLLSSNVSYGIAASSFVWTVSKNEVLVAESIREESFVLDHINDSNLGDAGYIHNKVIVELYKQYGEDFFELPQEEIVVLVNKEVSKRTGESLDDLNAQSADVLNKARLGTQMFIESNSIDEYFDKLKTLDPSKDDEFNVLKIVTQGFERIDIETDNGDYANKVIHIINDSNLPIKEKSELKSSVAIGNASVRLWNLP